MREGCPRLSGTLIQKTASETGDWGQDEGCARLPPRRAAAPGSREGRLFTAVRVRSGAEPSWDREGGHASWFRRHRLTLHTGFW